MRLVFRAEKYREEYDVSGATVTIDDTPVGVFIEIEAAAAVIPIVTSLLGRTPGDYRLESYPRLYLQWCEERKLTPGDMVFEGGGSAREAKDSQR
jgi:hypothetical protein